MNSDFAFSMNDSISNSNLEVGPDPIVYKEVYLKNDEIIDYSVINWGCGYYDAQRGYACKRDNQDYIDGYSYRYQQEQMEAYRAN